MASNRHTRRLRPVEKVAFTTIGHGLETPQFRSVPPGCILVVAAKSGNAMP